MHPTALAPVILEVFQYTRVKAVKEKLNYVTGKLILPATKAKGIRSMDTEKKNGFVDLKFGDVVNNDKVFEIYIYVNTRNFYCKCITKLIIVGTSVESSQSALEETCCLIISCCLFFSILSRAEFNTLSGLGILNTCSMNSRAISSFDRGEEARQIVTQSACNKKIQFDY